MYLTEEHYEQAAREFRSALETDQQNRMALSQLSIVLRRVGKLDEASAVLARLPLVVTNAGNAQVDQDRITVPHSIDRQ